ncbi:glycosyltransferase [Bacillus velezensis]|uniref:glycosyltransferase n=1 Tax=Bacillus velezensis TaxID=492670 RepID=UPI000CC8BDF4|nr:glycosyltransferase [Bacillus velezensis]AVB09273.1 hypothetical protein C3438_06815 [Bacillus velezensis]MCU9589582.1 glycosyltransferase [Bacillus velezensis]MEC0382049.1 glycosyltransferase [Bacillus velezensis]MEC0387035.1 glycosyltransferase [Bacillus velezensis]PJN85102.1 hypothetical protein CV739_07775 [Bacillus velezensis]
MKNLIPQIKNSFFLTDSFSFLIHQRLKQVISLKKNQLNASIVTFKYEKNFDESIDELERVYGFRIRSLFINMYRYFRSINCSVTNPQEVVSSILEDGMEHFKLKNESNLYLYYINGLLKKKKKYNDRFVLKVEEIYDNNEQLVQKNEYDQYGYLERTLFYKNKSNIKEYFYRRDGHCFLIKKTGINGDKKSNSISLFDDIGRIVHQFNSLKELRYYFLNKIVDGQDTLLLTDQDRMLKFMEGYDIPCVYKAYFVNSFLEEKGTSKRHNYVDGITRVDTKTLSNFDGVIFSTDYQKNDIENKHGKRNNSFVLPSFINPVDKKYNKKKTTNKYGKKLLMNANRADDIIIEQIIRALRIVANRIPTVTLLLLGITNLSENNQKLIDNLELRDNIVFYSPDSNDYTGNIYDFTNIYLNLTPSLEFTYQLMESLSHGCPVITRLFSYEAKSLIIDGENGWKISNHSIKRLSEKIVELLIDSQLANKMSVAATKVEDNFSEKRFLFSWFKLTNKMVENKLKRLKINDLKVYLSLFKWEEQNTLSIENNLFFTGEESLNGEPNVYLQLEHRTTRKRIDLTGELLKVDNLVYKTFYIVNLERLDLSQGIWDLYTTVEWANNYIRKRVGHYKNDSALIQIANRIVNSRVIKPYFTEKGDNISFNVGKYLTDSKEEIEKLQKAFVEGE